MNPLEKALHTRALLIAKNYHCIESDLIEILQKLDEKKVFRALGYSSLFQYAVEELSLSEQVAYSFIRVARKAREVPEIKKEIKAGNLTVSKAHRITAVVRKDNAEEWLEKARNLPKRQLEKELAKVQPKILTPEKSSYVTEKRLRIELGVDEALFEKLQRTKDILSQKMSKPASLEDALEAMTNLYLEKNDPVKKAKRLAKKDQGKLPEEKQCDGTASNNEETGPKVSNRDHKTKLCPGIVRGQVKSRKPIPSAVRHKVNRRDQGQCAYRRENGRRCSETRWLDFHHIIAVMDGGANEAINLITLCKTHHRLMHQDHLWTRGRQQQRQLLGQVGLPSCNGR